MSGYRVNLDIFAGPLDLLLYLVRKEEVDIYDISIAGITNQYLRYLEMLKGLDIDLAGDFLVMAATLIQIKSAMLLPQSDGEQAEVDDLSDPRTELIRQLLEYKKFKDAANLLSATADEHGQRFRRPGTIIDLLKGSAHAPGAEDASEREVDMEQVSVWDLLEAFDNILQATGSYNDISHITDDTPIDLYQIELLHRLQTEGPMTFERIFESRQDRLAIVGLFLGLLELVREKLVWVEQSESSGPLYLRALTEEPAEQVVQKAILAVETEAEPDSGVETEPVVEPAEPDSVVESEPAAEPPIPIVQLPPKSHRKTSRQEYEKVESGENEEPGATN